MRLVGATVLAGLGLVAGCDEVFGLQRDPPVQPDTFLGDPEGDFDRDDDANARDLCPTIEKTVYGANVDRDGDGVGDACDPHPDTPSDCLVLFDDFDAPSLSPPWRSQGEETAIYSDNEGTFLAFPHGPQNLLYLDVPVAVSAIYVKGYVQEGDTPQGNDRHAIEVFSDLALGSIGVSGRACTLESQATVAKLAVVDVANGVDTEPLSMALGPGAFVGSSNNYEIDWGTTPDQCHGLLEGTAVVDGSLTAKVPSGRRFGLRAVNTGFYVRVIAGWRTGCPAP